MGAIDARMEIEQTYTLEDFKEIADHGCQSGVCSQHIYYGDTVKFYEKYEEELIPYFIDKYDVDFLVELFSDAEASLTVYKNSVTWCFIEMIAFEAVEEAQEEYALSYAYQSRLGSLV